MRRHRVINIRPGGLLFKALTRPTLRRGCCRKHVEESRWPYRHEDGEYRLTPLGVLHRLFGITLLEP